MDNPDIVFALTGDLYRNARALKQLRVLADQGWTVHVLCISGQAPRVPLPETVSVEPLTVSKTRGYKFFRQVHEQFLEAAGRCKAACYHASDLYGLSAMCMIASNNGASYTYDSRELYAHVSATTRRPWVRWYWEYIESKYIGGAAAVFTVSERIAKHLTATYRIPRPTLVWNVPPRAHVVRSDKLSNLANLETSIPIVLHLGQLRRARGCETLVRSMKSVEAARLVFLGYGPEKENLQSLSEKLGLSDRIIFLHPVPPDEVLDYASGATVGVTLLQDTCLNHRYALPNKLFDYLTAGIPVLASDLPEIRALVQGYNVGKIVDPKDPEAVASVLNFMIGNGSEGEIWSRNAERLCETFNWENASQRFVATFRQIIAGYRVSL